jgi:hypothetical protein
MRTLRAWHGAGHCRQRGCASCHRCGCCAWRRQRTALQRSTCRAKRSCWCTRAPRVCKPQPASVLTATRDRHPPVQQALFAGQRPLRLRPVACQHTAQHIEGEVGVAHGQHAEAEALGYGVHEGGILGRHVVAGQAQERGVALRVKGRGAGQGELWERTERRAVCVCVLTHAKVLQAQELCSGVRRDSLSQGCVSIKQASLPRLPLHGLKCLAPAHGWPRRAQPVVGAGGCRRRNSASSACISQNNHTRPPARIASRGPLH